MHEPTAYDPDSWRYAAHDSPAQSSHPETNSNAEDLWIRAQLIAFSIMAILLDLIAIGGSLFCVFSDYCSLELSDRIAFQIKIWVPTALGVCLMFAGFEVKEKCKLLLLEKRPSHKLKLVLAVTSRVFLRTFAILPGIMVSQFDSLVTLHCAFVLLVAAPFADALWSWSDDLQVKSFSLTKRTAPQPTACGHVGANKHPTCGHVFCDSCFVDECHGGNDDCPLCRQTAPTPPDGPNSNANGAGAGARLQDLQRRRRALDESIRRQ